MKSSNNVNCRCNLMCTLLLKSKINRFHDICTVLVDNTYINNTGKNGQKEKLFKMHVKNIVKIRIFNHHDGEKTKKILKKEKLRKL